MLSYDAHPDFFTFLSRQGGAAQQPSSTLRDLMGESPFIVRYLTLLPQVDGVIARLYYIERLSQDQISNLLSITQAAVSRRLKYVLVRIKFLIKMPNLCPLSVRSDFEILFKPDLFEFAYFFYWEHAQNRVRYLIKTSQSGAANKFARVMSYLESVLALPEPDDDDETGQQRRHMALVYYDYFRFARTKANSISFLYKKFDKLRTGALVQGPHIFREEAVEEGERVPDDFPEPDADLPRLSRIADSALAEYA